jgi:hypothetical protein
MQFRPTATNPFILFLVLIFNVGTINKSIACSGYKITKGNTTIFGSNEDAWRTTPHIWFENATPKTKYGAVFTGSRFDGNNGYAPQSGMNETGLAFERLVAHFPLKTTIKKATIINPTLFLKDVLHQCKSVEEVKAYISRYDYSTFIEDVFLYVDQSGRYLIVEPYTITLGVQPTYLISNFCPSITSKQKANKLERYRNGMAFIKRGYDTSLNYCTALSDTMHVCRKKIGDGTLLTSIWNLNNLNFNLFFYHDYKTSKQFNLLTELKKGDHIIAIETLFPPNIEFEKLGKYKTPKNSILIGIFIVVSAVLFLVTALFFLIQYLRKRDIHRYSSIKLLLVPLSLILVYYMVVLSGSINVFYFSAPYKDPSNWLVSLSSYIPFLLAVLIIPVWLLTINLWRKNLWPAVSKGLLTLNALTYTLLIGLFTYWEFYIVWN